MNVFANLSRNFVLGEILARQARKNPKKIAFIEGDRELTYFEFNQRVNQLAHGLAGLGIKKGDKVAVLLRNCIEIEEIYFALAKLGAIAVPVNFRFVGREVAYVVNNSDSVLLIYGNEFKELVSSIKEDLPRVKNYIVVGDDRTEEDLDYEKLLTGRSTDEPGILVHDDDPAQIMYTSGTTGKPKGAVLTHKNQISNCISCVYEMDVNEDDIYLCVPPLFHEAAMAVVFHRIYTGSTTVIQSAFDPKLVAETVAAKKVTILFLVPAMWNLLLQVPGIEKYDLHSLRIAITGAAIMPVVLKKKLLETFPGIKIYDAFGQTEMSPVTTMLKPGDTLRKPNSVGRAIINTEIRVVDDEGNDVPIGEVGEIVYRGPGMFKEYYKDPQATEEAMRGGWFHSGDLVRMDEEGFVYVVDRKKDMIISGGENIYPAEVEEVLFQHPAVLEAAVIGIPDEKWGESVLAYIVKKPGTDLTAEEMINFCRGKLAGYKRPRKVEFIEQLPRNAAGKVLKTVLREQAQARQVKIGKN